MTDQTQATQAQALNAEPKPAKKETPAAASAKKKPAAVKPNVLPDNRRCTRPGCGGRLDVKSTQSTRLDNERVSVTRYVKCRLCAYRTERVEVIKSKKA